MRPRSIRDRRGGLLVALLLSSSEVGAAEMITLGQEQTSAAPFVAQAMPEDQRLDEYIRARQKFDDDSGRYWALIVEKRRNRMAKRRNNEVMRIDDYVLTQPPVYTGPPRPADLPQIPQRAPPEYVPVIADFLKSAAQYFNFAPERPLHEIDYKREYARVASSAGLTKEQVVRIYGFEAGGNGTYDVQAGLEYPTPGARASTTALGYNQLLNTTSVELMAEHGDQFLKALKEKAAKLSGAPKQTLENKIDVLRRVVEFSRTVPDDWSEHEKLTNTPKGLAIHSMNLDIDIGPLLQTQK